jgi:hypothetical protein
MLKLKIFFLLPIWFILFLACHVGYTSNLSTDHLVITDEKPETIFRLLPLIGGQGYPRFPLLIYDPDIQKRTKELGRLNSMEKEIITFIDKLDKKPQIWIFESSRLRRIRSEFEDKLWRKGYTVHREIADVDTLLNNHWRQRNYQGIVVSFQDEFLPYAAVFAASKNYPLAFSLEEAQKYREGNLLPITYFGNKIIPGTFNMTTISSLAKAQKKIAQLSDRESIIAMLHRRDNRLLPQDQRLYPVAALYAVLRKAALVTVKGFSPQDIASSFKNQLNSNIKPYWGIPQYLAVIGHWEVIPYRYDLPDIEVPDGVEVCYPTECLPVDGNWCFMNADFMYANLDNDPYNTPEIAVGRIASYTSASTAALLVNRSAFFSAGKMKKGEEGHIAATWIGIPESFLEYFQKRYSFRVRTFIEADASIPPPFSFLDDMAENAEMIALFGHGWLSNVQTNDDVDKATWGYLIAQRSFSPSLWDLGECSTGVYFKDYISEYWKKEPPLGHAEPRLPYLIDAISRAGGVNIRAAVDHDRVLAHYLSQFFTYERRIYNYLVPGEFSSGNKSLAMAYKKFLKDAESKIKSGEFNPIIPPDASWLPEEYPDYRFWLLRLLSYFIIYGDPAASF